MVVTPLGVQSSPEVESRERVSVFLSASIPDPARWDGPFDPLEITDAVVALTRVFLTGGVHMVTAAHPTIAPLVLYVAAEFPPDPSRESPITVYQSTLFEDVLPAATRRFQAEGVGRLIWTPAAPGEEPKPGSWDRSLAVMRQQILEESAPSAAVFIGGMEGIPAELELYREHFPERPVYVAGRPGGEARQLVDASPRELREALRNEDSYPALWRRVLSHMMG